MPYIVQRYPERIRDILYPQDGEKEKHFSMKMLHVGLTTSQKSEPAAGAANNKRNQSNEQPLAHNNDLSDKPPETAARFLGP